MSVRKAMFVAVSIAIGAVAASPGAMGAAAGLDYEFFKTKVQPIFVKKRENHARCIQCHTEANNFVRLERLAPGQTMWNEEQSKKNYEWVSKAVSPANRAQSRLLIHPLAPEAGGDLFHSDLFHSGGRQFESKSDPDYQVLMQWVGVTVNSGGFSK
jgi:hypothetical protein